MKEKISLIIVCVMVLFIYGCGGGGGGSSITSTSVTPTQTTTPDLSKAVDSYNSGDLNNAITNFNSIVISNESDTTTKSLAFEGLGFSYLKLDNLDMAVKNLKLAIDKSSVAAVTLSTTYIVKEGITYFDEAINTLETGIQNDSFSSTSLNTGVKKSQGEALAALLMKMRGNGEDDGKITEYKNAAEKDGTTDSLTLKILDALKLLE